MTQPANGVRLELTLVSNEAGSARYEGRALLAASAIAVTAVAEAAHATVTLGNCEGTQLSVEQRASLDKLITALVRAATRVELQKGEPIPRTIIRWRPLE